MLLRPITGAEMLMGIRRPFGLPCNNTGTEMLTGIRKHFGHLCTNSGTEMLTGIRRPFGVLRTITAMDTSVGPKEVVKIIQRRVPLELLFAKAGSGGIALWPTRLQLLQAVFSRRLVRLFHAHSRS